MNNLRVYLIALLLAVSGATLMHFRMKIFDVTLTPSVAASQWQIEALVTATANGGRGRIELELPSRAAGAGILEESFSAKDFNFAIVETDGHRTALWNARQLPAGPMQARYQIVAKEQAEVKAPTKEMKSISDDLLKLKPERDARLAPVLAKIRKATKGSNGQLLTALTNYFRDDSSELNKAFDFSSKISLEAKVRNFGALLKKAGYEVVIRKGIQTSSPKRYVSFYYWLQVKQHDKWKDVFIEDSAENQVFIPWGLTSQEALKTEGIRNPILSFSISPLGKDIKDLKEARKQTGVFWRVLSLDTLPVSAQAVYRLMLLIPIGAFLLAILRSMVGVKTFGTFMPVLIALSFREMDILWGIGLLSFVVFCGLFFRALFSKLHLLLVPRLAATLTVVILIVLATGVIAYDAGYEHLLTVTFFPIIVITMTVERMSLIWEESGPKEAIVRFGYSVLCAVVLYEIIFGVYLEYLVFTFPEVLLILLSVLLILGRYTGYRLTELYRFRSLVSDK